MNRPAPQTLRRRFFVALGHAINVTWPVLSAILAIQLALGLLTGFVEGWSLGDAVYFTFITGLTIGYGDLVPRRALTRALAIGIGFFGLFVTALIAAIAVHPCAQRSLMTGVAMSDLISTRDRVRLLFAALHESGCGTFETSRQQLVMSAFRGGSEVSGARSNVAIDPERTSDIRSHFSG
jgi:hypothetical protein